MGRKHLKFITIPEALEKLKNTMMMQSEVQQQEEIEPILAQIEDFKIRKDIVTVHPMDFVDRDGLWIKSNGSEKFNFGINLLEFLIDLLNSKSPETIAKAYSKVEWINANISKHPDTGVTGLLIETEMENFECIQCGHCCLDLSVDQFLSEHGIQMSSLVEQDPKSMSLKELIKAKEDLEAVKLIGLLGKIHRLHVLNIY